MGANKYGRVLLKLSGEAIAEKDEKDNVVGMYDEAIISRIAGVIRTLTEDGVEVGVVIGAGNIWRGAKNGKIGDVRRARADQMGMLATTMNCLRLEEALEDISLPAAVMSPVGMSSFTEPYDFRKAVEYMKNGKESDYEKVLDSIVKAETSGLNKEERRAVGLSGIEVMQMAQQMAMPWMRAFVELDPKAYLCKLKCPVLSLFGRKDVQVVARENEAGVRQSVPEQLLSVRVFDDMNHLFQRCSSGRVGEYMTIEETMAPEVMEAIGDWIVSTMSKNGQK